MNRRELLLALSGYGLGAPLVGGCDRRGASPRKVGAALPVAPPSAGPPVTAAGKPASRVLSTFRLGQPPWTTFDPFLFCVHHKDAYPIGNEGMGPVASLGGRNLGSDFGGKDGWSMYHGREIPGFPRHPHRGFETVTVTRQGFIDHSDSLGATARYGGGDVQWMTAGQGIVHAEMFPLLRMDGDNPTELFQIWINLPAQDKLVDPHFSMFWRERIPTRRFADAHGRETAVTVIAGALAGERPPSPPPKSWASRPDADVAIWSIRMSAGAEWSLPVCSGSADRTLYYFSGEQLMVGDEPVQRGSGVRLARGGEVPLVAGNAPVEVLLLQGRPIGEPIAKRGPFVMNTPDEIRQAYVDYRATQYGGWPWPGDAPVHGRTEGRFAIHADGRRERAG